MQDLGVWGFFLALIKKMIPSWTRISQSFTSSKIGKKEEVESEGRHFTKKQQAFAYIGKGIWTFKYMDSQDQRFFKITGSFTCHYVIFEEKKTIRGILTLLFKRIEQEVLQWVVGIDDPQPFTSAMQAT